MSEDGEERRKADFWVKWGNLATMGTVLILFATTWSAYEHKEGEKDAKLNYLVNQVSEFAASRYTKDDALKDQALNTAHYNDVSDRLRQLEWRANRAENYQARQPYVDHHYAPPPVQPSPMPKLVP